jgi:D-3-phosphoglycerate dehydrogenase
MIKVLISDKVDKTAVKIFEDAGIEVDYNPEITHEELKEVIKNYDGLVVRSRTKVKADIIEASEKLKVIGRAGAGVDNIDIQAATLKGIVVMNTPGGNTISTAEHTFAMLMAVSRNVPQAYMSLVEGRWDRKKYAGRELYGKTLAIIGLGNIGKVVAQRAKAFGMKIIGFDPYMSKELAQSLEIELLPLEEIWPKADYITVHTPLNDQTRNLINYEVLQKVKKGAYIINCARGGIVNEQDIVKAIDEGLISGL